MSQSKKITAVAAALSLVSALALWIPLVASGSAAAPRKHAAPGKHAHKKKHRHRTVRSNGGRLGARLGPLAIEAPKGAIRKGQTLTVEAGKLEKFPDPGAPSLVGGTYTLSTSQGEPAERVKVTFHYNRAKLSGGQPLVVHGLAGFGWVPEKTTVKPAAGSASALLESFSPIDVVDGITWAAGDITGNRTDLPTGCGRSPDWIDWLSPIYSRNDSLPACTGAESNSRTLYIHVANNRGYAQYLTISNATLDVRRSTWSDSLEGMIANQLAAHSSSNSPSSFVLAPGSHAVLAIDRPAEGFGTTAVSILAAAKGSSAMAAMGWALLNKVREDIGNRVDLVNCVTASIYNSLAADPGVSSAIGQLRSCAGAAAAGLKGTAKEVMGKISSAVLVVDLFYKLVDLQADEAIPPSLKFSIHGRNPTNPAIHVGGLSIGSVPAGQRTVIQLTANGGVAPYGFQISHAASNTAKVPSWVQLGNDGKLTIDPPADADDHVGFYVYATDASGQSSPFARDEVTFFVGAGDGTISWSGIEAPLPAGGIDSQLYSTTCPTANSCIAVGSYRRDFTQQGLIETYSNGVWTPTEAPLPPNAEGIEASLSSVACSPDATTCVAVGFYHGTDFKSHGLIETLSNGTWTATEATGSSSYSYLASVACSADNCFAVGNAGDAEAFVQILSNGTWTGGAAPLPANAVESYQQVRSAACSVDTCVAVGVYTNTNSRHRGLVEVLADDTLTPIEAPLPSETDLEGELGEIACAPTGPCVASGGYIDQKGSGHVFFGSVSGESWTPVLSTASLPPNASGANWWATACPAAGTCLGVGEFALPGFANRGLIETLSGGTWTGIEAPVPPPAVASDALLSGACPAVGRCVAVGRFSSGGGDLLGLIETLSNGEWMPTEAQLPANANADRFAELSDVACSNSTCVAVGRYVRSDLNEAGLIETGLVQQAGPG